MKGSVLYGTSYAQDAIFRHQHPASCEGKRFLQYAVHGFGPGSNIHTIGAALRQAMNEDRILILPPKKEEPQLFWYDPQWCPEARGWECWVLPVAGCTPGNSSDVKRLGYYQMTHTQQTPRVFNKLLACSPIRPSKYFYWWRAQSAAYLVRFNKQTRSALDVMRKELLYETHAGQTQPVAPALARKGGVAVLVRRGDKKGEMVLDSVQLFLVTVQQLFNGSQQIPVLHGSKQSFLFPSDAFAERRVFVHSEDPLILPLFKSFAGVPAGGHNSSMHWSVSFMKPKSACTGLCDPAHVLKTVGARQGTLMFLLSVEEALRHDAFACSMMSGWCRLVDELRMTIAGKADAPFIDISGNNPKSRRCPTCYLDFRLRQLHAVSGLTMDD